MAYDADDVQHGFSESSNASNSVPIPPPIPGYAILTPPIIPPKQNLQMPTPPS